MQERFVTDQATLPVPPELRWGDLKEVSATCVTPHHCSGARSAPSRAVRDAQMATGAELWRAIRHKHATRRSVGICLNKRLTTTHRIVGTFARFPQQHNNVRYAPRPVCVAVINVRACSGARASESTYKTSPLDRKRATSRQPSATWPLESTRQCERHTGEGSLWWAFWCVASFLWLTPVNARTFVS